MNTPVSGLQRVHIATHPARRHAGLVRQAVRRQTRPRRLRPLQRGDQGWLWQQGNHQPNGRANRRAKRSKHNRTPGGAASAVRAAVAASAHRRPRTAANRGANEKAFRLLTLALAVGVD
jgi:hypothetical protein